MRMKKPIRKAIFPVAGLGTRFLPATKANPKEMLPIVDKPIIQYAVEEAVQAGITELVFITSSSKRSIEDHFDSNFELENKLKESGKNELLEMVQNILPKGVSSVYVRQIHPLGLGHAVWCAKNVVGDEPFAVILADDLIDAGAKPCLKQMVELYEQTEDSILAIQEVPRADTEKYGIIEINDDIKNSPAISRIVEKPKAALAPSNFAVVGRYILSPTIFSFLDNQQAGHHGEIQLTDGIASLINVEKVRAYLFSGTRYDCGNKLGYLQATVSYGRRHPEVGKNFELYLQSILADLK
jgi:UTP--glucose-1-phosphate uridylyltransferase